DALERLLAEREEQRPGRGVERAPLVGGAPARDADGAAVRRDEARERARRAASDAHAHHRLDAVQPREAQVEGEQQQLEPLALDRLGRLQRAVEEVEGLARAVARQLEADDASEERARDAEA